MLFKLVNKRTGKYRIPNISVNYFKNIELQENEFSFDINDSEYICQSTDYKDSKGRRIFEKDLVRFNDPEQDYILFTVEKGEFDFELVCGGYIEDIESNQNKISVVGNAFEIMIPEDVMPEFNATEQESFEEMEIEHAEFTCQKCFGNFLDCIEFGDDIVCPHCNTPLLF